MPYSYDLPRLVTRIAIDTVYMGRGLSLAERKMQEHAIRMGHIGTTLSLAVSVPVQIALAAAIRTFAELEDSAIKTMSRIEGGTKEMAYELNQFSIELSRTIPFPALEIQEATDQITRFGKSIIFAKGAAEGMAKFAFVARMKDIRTATDDTMQTFMALGLETGNLREDLSRLRDLEEKIIITQQATGFTGEAMLDAFRTGANQARQFGLSLKDYAATLKAIQVSGKEAGEVGTSFNMAMRAIMFSRGKVPNVWKALLGIDPGEMQKLDPIKQLELLSRTIRSFPKEDLPNVFKELLIEPRQVSHVMGILQNIPALKSFREELERVNVIEEQFAEMVKSTKAQLVLLWNTFVGLGQGIGGIVVKPILLFLKLLFAIAVAFETVWKAMAQIPILGQFASFIMQTVVALTLLGLATSGPAMLFYSWLSRLGPMLALGRTRLVQFIFSLLAVSKTMKAKIYGAPTTFAGLFQVAGWNKLSTGIRSVVTSLAAVPVSGWIALGVAMTGVVYGLSKIINKLKETKQEILALREGFPTGMFMDKVPRFKRFTTPSEYLRTLSVLERADMYFPPHALRHSHEKLLEQINKTREDLEKNLQSPVSIAAKKELLAEARRLRAITEEEHLKALELITKPPEVEEILGTKRYRKTMKEGRAGEFGFFSATTYGTEAEYRARVIGQQSLLGASTGILQETKRVREQVTEIHRHTRDTVEELRKGKPRPANLK
jgi:TP901 family phage tail tape measure protein